MAIKFFKTLGLSKLFKKDSQKKYYQTSSVSGDNLTNDAKSLGVTSESIVHVTAEEGDAVEFGGRFVTGTNVLWILDQPFFDSKNILFGISLQCKNYDVYLTAPKGVLKEGDIAVLGRLGHNRLNGWTVPVLQGDPDKKHLPRYTFPIRYNGSGEIRMGGNTLLFEVPLVMHELNTALLNLREELTTEPFRTKNIDPGKYTLGLSIWRDNVRVSEWLPFEYDYLYVYPIDPNTSENIYRVDNLPEKTPGIKTKKGLYLPGILEVTYNKLMVLIAQERLVPGRLYCITDYKPSSIKDDLIYSGAENSGLYVKALTNNTLSENGVIVYGDQVCDVKYGVKKNRWSGNWKLIIPSGVKNIEGEALDYPVTWIVTTASEVPLDIKSKLIGLNGKGDFWFYTTDSAINHTYWATNRENILFYDAGYLDILGVDVSASSMDVSCRLYYSDNITTFDNDAAGEIYWMRDSRGNEATYDFKGYKLLNSGEPVFTFDQGDENEGYGTTDSSSGNGTAYGNKLLFEGYDSATWIGLGKSNIVLTNKYSEGDVTVGIQYDSSIIVAKHFATPTGTDSDFLMANGSVLSGLQATAESILAGEDALVEFKNGTFNFKIPMGRDGDPGKDGTITGTSGDTSGDFIASITMDGSNLKFTKGNNISGYANKIREYTKFFFNSNKTNPGLLYNKGFALLHDYAGTWENMPSGFNYGHVLNLGCDVGTLDTLLAFGYDTNRSAYIRTADILSSNIDSALGIPTDWKDSSNDYGWKRIAWASELSSYLQLSGGMMTGAIRFNRTGDFILDSSGFTILAIVPDSGEYTNATATLLVLGNAARETNIRGSASTLKYNNKEVALASDYVKKTGDTMTGNLNIINPSSNPALGVGSSAITYNKTTGCLEITA